MEIEGKRVLITGTARGLGRELVTACLRAQAAAVFAGVRDERQFEEFQAEGSRVTPLLLDVTNEEQVSNLAMLDPFDILVNNAGFASFGNPLTKNFDEIRTEMEVNYFGTLRVSRVVAPKMIERRRGVIVNVATAFAKVNLPMIGTYCASKAALLSLGQALRAYLTDYGVKVITVMPTTIDTDMSRGADVPKMTTAYVAGEILSAIRDEQHDPPIGDEARGVLERLGQDPQGLEKFLMQYR
ncbi:MAG TPA: SDR family NAD(P)-dependent oxidoreductase [Pyrinomonadaceae bacterium]|nr:SDR family NAD(P)-dependent oxidoreductase [Pyrinomonadaceae bacterium]